MSFCILFSNYGRLQFLSQIKVVLHCCQNCRLSYILAFYRYIHTDIFISIYIKLIPIPIFVSITHSNTPFFAKLIPSSSYSWAELVSLSILQQPATQPTNRNSSFPSQLTPSSLSRLSQSELGTPHPQLFSMFFQILSAFFYITFNYCNLLINNIHHLDS